MVNIFLPLLFADGQPTSLEKITLNQLEKFIPFMMSCCPDNGSDGPPAWWPSSIPYQFPLRHSGDISQWSTRLKELVCSCYQFYNCEHVLRFCCRLADLPPSILRYKECAQGFMSIYNKRNNKLIVTYKKRNQIYDRPASSPLKRLLPRKPSQGPPRDQHIEDIYLCNYCDEEFTSGKDAVAHEAACKGKVDDKVLNNEALDQVSVMRYFGLTPASGSPKTPGTPSSRRGTSVRLTARSYMQVPISSPLGLKMSANVLSLCEEEKLDLTRKLDSLCCSRVFHSTSQTRRPRLIGRGVYTSFRRKRQEFWTHSYCFNRAQRKEKLLTIKTGLNKQARALQKRCKTAYVLIERLPILDPVALHAAASLQRHIPSPVLEDRDCNNPAETKPSTVEPSDTLCIDLTCEESDECLSRQEESAYSSSSSDSFFHSSSNHKRPPIDDWSTLFPRISVPTSLMPVASM